MGKNNWLMHMAISNPRPCASGSCQQSDEQLANDLSGDLYFEQDKTGHINHIYFPEGENASATILKRGKRKYSFWHYQAENSAVMRC